MKHLFTTPNGYDSRLGIFSYGDIPGFLELASNITDTHTGLDIEHCSTLTSVSYPNLTQVGPDSDSIFLVDCAALANVSFPELVFVGSSVNVEQCPSVPNLLFPKLTSLSYFNAVNNPACTQIDLRLLQFATSLYIGVDIFSGAPNDGALTSVNLDSLAGVSLIQISQCDALTSLSFPALISTDSLSIFHCPALTSVSLPVWLPTNGQQVAMRDNALDQTTVDLVLARCIANPAYVTGTVDLFGGTNSAPSAAGLLDKAALGVRGVTVFTN